jgi:hypothetical protein
LHQVWHLVLEVAQYDKVTKLDGSSQTSLELITSDMDIICGVVDEEGEVDNLLSQLKQSIGLEQVVGVDDLEESESQQASRLVERAMLGDFDDVGSSDLETSLRKQWREQWAEGSSQAPPDSEEEALMRTEMASSTIDDYMPNGGEKKQRSGTLNDSHGDAQGQVRCACCTT